MKRNSAQNMSEWGDSQAYHGGNPLAPAGGRPFPEPPPKRGREFYDYNDRMDTNNSSYNYSRNQQSSVRDYPMSVQNQPPPQQNQPHPLPNVQERGSVENSANDKNMSTYEKLKMMDALLDGLITTEAEATIATNIMNFLTKNLLHYKIQTLPPSIEDVLTKTLIGGDLQKLGNVSGLNSPHSSKMNPSSNVQSSAGMTTGSVMSGIGAAPMSTSSSISESGTVPRNLSGPIQMGTSAESKVNIPGGGTNQLQQQVGIGSQPQSKWDMSQKKDLADVSNTGSLPNALPLSGAPVSGTSGHLNWEGRTLGPNQLSSIANMPTSASGNIQSNDIYERREPNSQTKPPLGNYQNQHMQGHNPQMPVDNRSNPSNAIPGRLPDMNWEVGRKGDLGSNPLYTNANMSANSTGMQGNQGQLGSFEMKRGIPSSGNSDFYERREPPPLPKPPLSDDGSKQAKIPGLTLTEDTDGETTGKLSSGEFSSGSSAMDWGQKGQLGRPPLPGSNSQAAYNRGNMDTYQMRPEPPGMPTQEQNSGKPSIASSLPEGLTPTTEISAAVNKVLSLYSQGGLTLPPPPPPAAGPPMATSYEQNSARFPNANSIPSTQPPRREEKLEPQQGYNYPNPYQRDYMQGNRRGPPGGTGNEPPRYGRPSYPPQQSYPMHPPYRY